MRDVAREAGVAVGTVSRVMNNEPGVKAENRERVVEAARRLGWVPNSIAASMRTATTRTIAFIVPDIRNPLFSAIEWAAESALRESGYTLIVANTNYESALEMGTLKLLLERRVDGVMISPSADASAETLRVLRQATVPVVLLDRDVGEFDSVVSDQFGGMTQAVDHLLMLGHRRIALVTGGLDSRPGRERHRGFVAAHEEQGIAFDPDLVRLESFGVEFAHRAVHELMTRGARPTALITGGNLMLAGALRALNALRVDIPKDLSVIAIGDTDLSAFASPSFTAIRWDLEQFGRAAAAKLLARLRGESAEAAEQVVIPTEIVLRRSCLPVR